MLAPIVCRTGAPTVSTAIAFPEHLGGCYACRWFGERVDVAVLCARPNGEHVRSQADRGCVFWEREPGADDDLPAPASRVCIAPMLLYTFVAAVMREHTTRHFD